MPRMIDLRSDTVTRPTEAVRQVMAKADVGDDVYGEDPSIIRLEARVAGMLGKEQGLYVASGVQSNLLALLCHCQRGDEYIVGQDYHTYKYEGGGAAVLGSIQPQPIQVEADGSLDLQRVESVIKPKDLHFARSRLLSLENTHGGKVIGLDYLSQARALCDRRQLGLHLDGARMMNAAVELQCEAIDIAKYFDSVSLCLSKGLGAPVGSVLSGSKDFIEEAIHWRKMLGGGMRQAGILAAAGEYVLDHHVTRLADDHAHAQQLAKGLGELAGVSLHGVATNILYIGFDRHDPQVVATALKEKHILISPAAKTRLVTHLDVHAEDVPYVVQCFAEVMASLAA